MWPVQLATLGGLSLSFNFSGPVWLIATVLDSVVLEEFSFSSWKTPPPCPRGCVNQELTDRSDAHGETSPGFVSLVFGGRCDADSLLGGYGASLCHLGLHRCPCREI